MARRIEDYALIGDCETAALVGNDGSIDWLCWPRFDSDACFAALLGNPDNGRWLLAPQGEYRVRRAYRQDTLILDTRFESTSGTVVVTDFMPPRGEASDLVRIVTCERGEVRMRCEVAIRFNYGSAVPWVTRAGERLWHAVCGPDMLVLQSEVDLHGENLKTVGEFTLRAGQSVSFVLLWAPSHLDPPVAPAVAQALEETEQFWREWAERAKCPPCYGEAARRSLITLRALIYRPTGGIVAAPTTSLPEHPGGVRNWDYRFCWLRDATMTLFALMDGGYYDEAAAWRDWLLRAVAGSPDQLQIMYGVAGERRLTEWEVPWLSGYEGSLPVRVGNHASQQLQLDVFGEVMDALHHARKGQIVHSPAAWQLQHRLLEHLCSAWQQPDYGIWEVRGPPRHFTHSKIMCWVAFDRGIRDAEQYGYDAPLQRWRAIRAQIHREVCERGFDRELNSFVQSYDSKQLDASLLLIPQLGFLPAEDPRVLGTITAIERTLVRDGLVDRYNTREADDGLPPGEGAFLACSFWLVDALALTGRMDEARALFDRLLSLRNDVGLLAEEYDPVNRRMLGNFPQGFSHLALVNTAFNLAGRAQPARQRADQESDVGR